MLTLVPNQQDASGSPYRHLMVRNPADGSFVGSVSCATDEEIAAALCLARVHAAVWAATPLAERSAALLDMAEAVEEHAGELAALHHDETGRARQQSRDDVSRAAALLRTYGLLGAGSSAVTGTDGVDYTRKEPRGVVVLLTTWTSPLTTAARLLGAALLAGNVVLHKPSEHCPHLGRRLGELLDGQLPVGVLTTLIGGPDVGSLLASASGVDVVAHVGSAENGRQISVWATETGAHVIREGGGNDALLIDGDVDPEWAAELAAQTVFGDRGSASATGRILVHADVAEPFVAALARRARDLNLSDDRAPLIDSRARITLQDTVTASVAAGAVVLVGGRIPRGDGWHYPATVVANCPLDSKLMTQETSAAVASVATVPDFETGLVLAALDTQGRGATVLSGSTSHIFDAVETLQVKTLAVNTVTSSSPDSWATGGGALTDLLSEMTVRKRVRLGIPVLAEGASAGA